VLVRMQHALDKLECLDEHMSGQAGLVPQLAAVDTRGHPVETKVGSLMKLLKSQRDEIDSLRQELAASRASQANSLTCRQPSPSTRSAPEHAEGDESRGAALFLKQQRLHVGEEGLGNSSDARVTCAPMQGGDSCQGYCAARAPRFPHKHGCADASARDVIEFSASQAHILIDVCEVLLLRGVAAALEMLDQALHYLCLQAPVLSDLQHQAGLPSCPPTLAYAAQYSCQHQEVGWWWMAGGNLYDIYC
jgi:hypothetical protein